MADNEQTSRPLPARVRRASRRRAGYSLVELLVVISVNSVLMATAAVLLGTLLRTEQQGRQHFERTSAMMRLSQQWRTDVAAARKASLVACTANGEASTAARPPDHLRLQGPETRAIEYWPDGDRLRRAEYQDQTVLRREAYTLADLAETEFMLSDDEMVMVRLTIGHAEGEHDVWSLESHLASDSRFSTEEEP
ncbi:MAG TPA: prepilin-type N-terminal cleavage/methylation domain-containing protein [Pirellulales bacterium]|nr:prepilin-type N-terminal cleavage/methylation domain-containing protein [Pirellulales bacterium]